MWIFLWEVSEEGNSLPPISPYWFLYRRICLCSLKSSALWHMEYLFESVLLCFTSWASSKKEDLQSTYAKQQHILMLWFLGSSGKNVTFCKNGPSFWGYVKFKLRILFSFNLFDLILSCEENSRFFFLQSKNFLNCEIFTAFFRNSLCCSISRATWLSTLWPQALGSSRAFWSFGSKEMSLPEWLI